MGRKRCYGDMATPRRTPTKQNTAAMALSRAPWPLRGKYLTCRCEDTCFSVFAHLDANCMAAWVWLHGGTRTRPRRYITIVSRHPRSSETGYPYDVFSDISSHPRLSASTSEKTHLAHRRHRMGISNWRRSITITDGEPRRGQNRAHGIPSMVIREMRRPRDGDADEIDGWAGPRIQHLSAGH